MFVLWLSFRSIMERIKAAIDPPDSVGPASKTASIAIYDDGVSRMTIARLCPAA
jgi:hypothetical protein